MYFSVSRNFYMRAPIEAIPVALGSSQKVEQKTNGASSGVLVTPNQETLHFVRVCVLIFYVLFCVSRNFWMRAPIEAILAAPGSSRKVEQKTTGASSGAFGASSGVLVTPN